MTLPVLLHACAQNQGCQCRTAFPDRNAASIRGLLGLLTRLLVITCLWAASDDFLLRFNKSFVERRLRSCQLGMLPHYQRSAYS